MYLKIALYLLFGQPEFCLILILSKSIDFPSGALLKMPSLFPSMKEFGLDIQKQISLKQVKTYLSRNCKNTLKYAGFNGKFDAAVAPLDIHYNSSLNTKVQKQNEAEIKKL